MTAEKNYRISGHESFPCRYAWLPKAARSVAENPRLFSDEDQAMVELGVGKNMTRSIRFWAQAAGIVSPLAKGSGHSLTEFGRALLGQDSSIQANMQRESEPNVGRANLQVCPAVRSLRKWEGEAPAEPTFERIPRFGGSLTLPQRPGDRGRTGFFSEAEARRAGRFVGECGLDPFLEDVRTLWLLHWNLSTDWVNPLLAWDFLLNRWQEPELVPSKALKALEHEAAMHDDKLSPVTVQQHFETFLHTYVPTRGRKGEVQEDNLDCPLVELEFIVKIGEREVAAAGKREPIYAFRREEKPEITPGLFVYCLNDFWQKRHGREETLPFREIAYGHGSPGQILKIPEEDVRTRVEVLDRQTGGFLTYVESANISHLRKKGDRDRIELLQEMYAVEATHV